MLQTVPYSRLAPGVTEADVSGPEQPDLTYDEIWSKLDDYQRDFVKALVIKICGDDLASLAIESAIDQSQATANFAEMVRMFKQVRDGILLNMERSGTLALET
jgi:hypothetical protein